MISIKQLHHKTRLSAALVAGLLIVTSMQTHAFDFKGALKDAIDKKLENKPEPSQEAAPTETSVDANKGQQTQEIKAIEAKPVTSEPSINWKSPSQAEEIAVGREIAGNLLGAAPLVKDEALQKYVNSVGRWVATQSERPDLPWHFGVIESDDLNAFAMPGGNTILISGNLL